MLAGIAAPKRKIVDHVAATAKQALQWLNRVAGAYSDEEKLEIIRTFMAAVCSRRGVAAATALMAAGTAVRTRPFLPGTLEISYTPSHEVTEQANLRND